MSNVQNSKRKYFALPDLLVLGFVILALVIGVSALFAQRTQNGLVAVVSVGGEIYREIPLDDIKEPYELTVDGEESAVLLVSSDGVRFVSSECPDKLCVNTGLLTHSGESAVCLPARISVKLISCDKVNSDAPDAVAG